MHDGSSPTSTEAPRTSAALPAEAARRPRARPATLPSLPGRPVLDQGCEAVDGVAQDPSGGVELAGGDPGEAAAEGLVGEVDPVAGGFQDLDGGLAGHGGEVVGEGVRPQQHARGGWVGPARRPGGGATTARKVWGANLGRGRRGSTPARRLATWDRPGVVEQGVGQARGPGGEGGPAGQPAERVVGRRAQPAAVGLVQDLGLVGGHVDAGRAVGRAALAGQAQVERLARPRVTPAAGPGVPLTASWSTRARPRVESFSSRVAR